MAASLYAAMMTDVCLELTGAAGAIVVEGPFARNALYTEALSKVTGRPVIPVAGSTGTSLGAALLAGGLSTAKSCHDNPETISDHLPESFQDYYSVEWNKHVRGERVEALT